MRFALEVVKEIQSVIAASGKKDFILGYRISPDEPIEDGLKVSDTLALTEELITLGIDYLHTSLVVAYDTKAPSDERTYVQVFAQKLKGRIPLISAGTIQTPEQAQLVLEQGADFVAIGHALITDPSWVEKAATNQSNNIQLSIKKSKIASLVLPDLLWEQLQAMDTWFTIEE